MRSFRVALCLLLPLLLSGCIFFETHAQRAMRNDPNFHAGYNDGCASANARGSNYRGDIVRDDGLYQASAAYRAGWGAGAETCNTQINGQSDPNHIGIPDARTGP